VTATPSTPAAWTPDIPAAEAEFERCTGEPVWRWLVRWASEFAVGGLDLYRIAAVTATLLYRCFPRRPGPAIRREDELDIHAAAAHTVLAVARHETRDRRWVALADALLGDPGFDAFCAWLDGPFRRVQRAYLEARTNLNAHARAAKSSQQRQQALRWLEDDLLRECPGPDEQAVIDMLLPFDCAGTGHRPPSAPNGLAAAVRKAAKLCGTGDPVQNREDLRQLLVRRLLAGVSGRPPAAALEGDDLAGAPERQDAWMRHLMVGDDGRVVVSDLALRNAVVQQLDPLIRLTPSSRPGSWLSHKQRSFLELWKESLSTEVVRRLLISQDSKTVPGDAGGMPTRTVQS